MRRLTLLAGALLTVLDVALAGASPLAGSVPARWVMTDLGTLGGRTSYAMAINERGQVIGSSGTRTRDAMGYEVTHAFLWRDGKMIDLGINPAGYNANRADRLNEHGQVLVNSERIVPVGNTEGTVRSQAFLWENGRRINLGSFGGKLTTASAINERGQIVGWSETGARDKSGGPIEHAFLWQNGKLRDLGRGLAIAINNRGQIAVNRFDYPYARIWQNGKTTTLGTLGGRGSTAVALNDQGQIAGVSYSTKNGGSYRVFLWQHGKMRDLGRIRDGYVVALNNKGQICESSDWRSYRWQSGKLTNLGTLGRKGYDGRTQARAMNERGQIVGYSVTMSGQQHGFVWENGKLTDLGTLGGQTSEASAINDRGQIVGVSETKNGQTHAVLWKLHTSG